MKFFLAFITSFCLAFFSYAEDMSSPEALAEVRDFVETAGLEVLEILKTESNEEEIREAEIKEKVVALVEKYIDTEWFITKVGGIPLKEMNEDQKERFYSLAYETLITTISSTLGLKQGQDVSHVKIVRVNPKKNRWEAITQIHFNPKAERPAIDVTWRIHRDETGALKAIDLVGGSFSILINKRKEVKDIFKTEGIEGLLAKMEAGLKLN